MQYISLVASDDTAQGSAYGEYSETNSGARLPWIDGDQYNSENPAGHGTHAAGSAAGATLSFPANTTTCASDRVLSCVGGCIVENSLSGDDLVSASLQNSLQADIDRLCPKYGCDGWGDEVCLSDDAATTLAEHGGMAPGAKISVFDVLTETITIGTYLAGSGLWDPAMEIGGKLHSNSWGGDLDCQVDFLDVLFDRWMFNVSDEMFYGQPISKLVGEWGGCGILTKVWICMHCSNCLCFDRPDVFDFEVASLSCSLEE